MKNSVDGISEAPPLKVSIIIDNFNYDRFLNDAISSALSQTYPNCEVIVVDDGSTDNSREILKTYTDRVIVLLKENGGQASAFNLGFEKSTGDLVLFLDSDDTLDPDAIETAVKAWQPNYSKLQFSLRVIGPDNKPNGLKIPSCTLSNGLVSSELINTGYYITAPTSGNLYSRAFLSKLMPMPVEGWSEGNDSYLNTYAGFLGEVGAIQTQLGSYRVHTSNMSSVAAGKTVNLTQVDKLIGHGLRQQALIRQIAGQLNLTVPPRALESHWFHLKLLIAKEKLAGSSGFASARKLAVSVYRFCLSVCRETQLTLIRKFKLISWSLLAACLPRFLAEEFVSYAFEKSPQSRFLRLLRRS